LKKFLAWSGHFLSDYGDKDDSVIKGYQNCTVGLARDLTGFNAELVTPVLNRFPR